MDGGGTEIPESNSNPFETRLCFLIPHSRWSLGRERRFFEDSGFGLDGVKIVPIRLVAMPTLDYKVEIHLHTRYFINCQKQLTLKWKCNDWPHWRRSPSHLLKWWQQFWGPTQKSRVLIVNWIGLHDDMYKCLHVLLVRVGGIVMLDLLLLVKLRWWHKMNLYGLKEKCFLDDGIALL